MDAQKIHEQAVQCGALRDDALRQLEMRMGALKDLVDRAMVRELRPDELTPIDFEVLAAAVYYSYLSIAIVQANRAVAGRN